MPVQIGAKTHPFTEPLGLLSDCHRRIEMFLGSLSAIARLDGQLLNDEGRYTLENALRYFREAAPKHTADEEQSLFPRLSALHSEESASLLARMEELEKEHQWVESLHTEVDRIGMQYLNAGILLTRDAEEFANLVERLSAMYERHIRFEDESLFPVAATVLSPTDQLAIAKEMALRRRR